MRFPCLVRRAFCLVLWGLVCGLALSGPVLRGKQKKVPRVVTGVVTDEADNPIAGAAVEMTDLANQKKLAIYTDQDGRYQFSDLKPNHDYKVQASYKGAFSEVRTASSLDSRNRIVLNLKILPAPAGLPPK